MMRVNLEQQGDGVREIALADRTALGIAPT